MPAYDTIPICDRDHPWEITEDSRGMRGTRYYRVAHHDPLMAAKYGAGLPAQGSAWDPSEAPSLTVARRVPRFMGGVTQASPARVGWCEVRVEYETSSGSGTLPPPLAGTKWSEIAVSGRTETLYQGLNQFGQEPLPQPPIENGDGYPKEVGVVELRVLKYYDKNAAIDWPRLNTLGKERSINLDQVVTPTLYKHPGSAFTLAPNTAQFMGYEASMVSDVLLLSITLMLGVTRDKQWSVKDDKGNFSGGSVTSQIYRQDAFAGLW